jgi:outer membrane protein TolC
VKIFFLCFWILIFLTLPASSQAITVRFEDLPRLVKSQNENVKAENSTVKASQIETHHLARSFLPRVHVQGGGEVFKTGNFDTMTNPVGGVDVNLNLINGGKDHLEEKIRQNEHTLSQTRRDRTYAQELLEARTLFAEILYQAEIIRTLKSALKLNQNNIVAVEKRIQAGLTTKADRLDFQIYISQLRQELILASEDHEHAIEELKVSLGIPLAASLLIRGSLNHAHDQALYLSAIDPELHPDVQVLKKQEQILDLKRSQANRWWTPTLDVYASYALDPFRERNFFPQSDRDETVGGLKLSMKLFDGLESHTKASALKFRSQTQKYQAQHRSREVQTLYQRYQHELKIRHDLVHLVGRSGVDSQKYLTLTLSEYETGVKNAPDVLSASQRILDNKRRSADSRKEYWAIKAKLLALQGQ